MKHILSILFLLLVWVVVGRFLIPTLVSAQDTLSVLLGLLLTAILPLGTLGYVHLVYLRQ